MSHIMMEASKFEIVIVIVSFIRLKVGGEEFKEHALLLKKYGAAGIVMEFDEGDQTATAIDKVRIYN